MCSVDVYNMQVISKYYTYYTSVHVYCYASDLYSHVFSLFIAKKSIYRLVCRYSSPDLIVIGEEVVLERDVLA